MTTAPPPATSPSDEPFRPRRGRRVAQIGIVVAVVLFGFVAVLMPGADQGGNWTIVDRVLLWGLGWGMALLLQRYDRLGHACVAIGRTLQLNADRLLDVGPGRYDRQRPGPTSRTSGSVGESRG